MSAGRQPFRFIALVVPLLLVATAANAASRESQQRAAKKACLLGDYTKGVAILSDLYVETNDATYIFNQGRCFEQSGRYEDAIIRFREFLRKKMDAEGKTDASAERHIADCEALLAKQKGQPAAPTQPAFAQQPEQPTQSAPPPPAANPPTVAEPQPALPAVAAPPVVAAAPPISAPESENTVPLPEAKPGLGLRIAGIASLGVGVAGIATGVFLALKANNLAKELEASPTSYQRSKESTRASYSTFSTVGYAIGAAGLAGGAILYYFGFRQGRAESLALLPALGPSTAGAVVQGAF